MIEASCHCGAVRFSLAEPPETLTDCNCSICSRLGTLWAYYRPDQVTFQTPPEATFQYAWGDKGIAFHHCRTCGCTTHWSSLKGGDRLGVNARLMDPEVRAKARVRRFDGASSWTFLDEG
jgi:hypothetical protein